MNIIWLCSWYPNTEDHFRGDFIQRQAIAASAFANIDVVHVVFCKRNEVEVKKVNGHLTEHIIYLKKKNKFSDLFRLYRAHHQFMQQYRKLNGLPDVVHVQIPLTAGLIAMQWKSNFFIPYVLTEHYGIYNHSVEDHFENRSFIFRYFTRQVIRQADRFLPVSNSLGRDVNDMVLKKEFTAIPNVVDTTLFCYHKKPDTKFRFIHVSNMAPLKNVKGILEAMALLAGQRTDFECVFIGSNEQDIETQARALGIFTYCKFFGEVPYQDVASQVQQAHAGLLFSTTESQSCVVLEWLCSGLPVISSAVGGVTELINESNGLLVPSGDVTALATTMDQMIARYHLYDGVAISKNATALYSYEAVGRNFYEVYKNLRK